MLGSMRPMRRIAIVGPMAVGKSTLAIRLGELLELPTHHLDALYWRPGWEPTPADEWDALLERIVAGDEWIIDGGFTQSMPMRFEAADTLIYVDLPRRVSFASLVKRRLFHAVFRSPGVPAHCRPMFNLQLFRWIWDFPETHRPVILELLSEYARGRNVVHLRSRADVRHFVAFVADAGLVGRQGTALHESTGDRAAG
jgi:adenylate kinase family enzyme